MSTNNQTPACFPGRDVNAIFAQSIQPKPQDIALSEASKVLKPYVVTYKLRRDVNKRV